MSKPKCCGKLRRIYHIAAMVAFLLCPVLTGFVASADGAPCSNDDAGKNIWRDYF